MKRLLAELVVPVLALTVLSGCGGDQETKADEATSTSPSPSAPVDDPSEGSAEPDPDAPGAGTKYCELLSTDFATLFANIQGPEDVDEAVAVIKRIADEAPAEVESEWAVMESALADMNGALIRAAELQEQAAAGKVSKEKMQRETAKLMKDMQALDTPENNQAGDAVAKHASEYCGVSLG